MDPRARRPRQVLDRTLKLLCTHSRSKFLEAKINSECADSVIEFLGGPPHKDVELLQSKVAPLKLFPHQLEYVAWQMSRLNRTSINATEPGLGKSLQVLALVTLKNSGLVYAQRHPRTAVEVATPPAVPAVPSLFIVPDHLVWQWKAECDRIDLSWWEYSRDELKNDKAPPDHGEVEVVLVAFDVAREMKNYISKNRHGGTNHRKIQLLSWNMIVVDEIEELGKTDGTNLKVTVRDLVDRNARATVIGMTGTPNKFEDLGAWSKLLEVLGAPSEDSSQECVFRTTRNDLQEGTKEHLPNMHLELTEVIPTDLEKSVYALAREDSHRFKAAVNPKSAIPRLFRSKNDRLTDLKDGLIRMKRDECETALKSLVDAMLGRCTREALIGDLNCGALQQDLDEMQRLFKDFTGLKIPPTTSLGEAIYCMRYLACAESHRSQLIKDQRARYLAPNLIEGLKVTVTTFPWNDNARTDDDIENAQAAAQRARRAWDIDIGGLLDGLKGMLDADAKQALTEQLLELHDSNTTTHTTYSRSRSSERDARSDELAEALRTQGFDHALVLVKQWMLSIQTELRSLTESVDQIAKLEYDDDNVIWKSLHCGNEHCQLYKFKRLGADSDAKGSTLTRCSIGDYCDYCQVRSREAAFVKLMETYFSKSQNAEKNTLSDTLIYSLLTRLNEACSHAGLRALVGSLEIHMNATLGQSIGHEINGYSGRQEHKTHGNIHYILNEQKGLTHPNVTTIVYARACELLARTPMQKVLRGRELPRPARSMSEACMRMHQDGQKCRCHPTPVIIGDDAGEVEGRVRRELEERKQKEQELKATLAYNYKQLQSAQRLHALPQDSSKIKGLAEAIGTATQQGHKVLVISEHKPSLMLLARSLTSQGPFAVGAGGAGAQDPVQLIHNPASASSVTQSKPPVTLLWAANVQATGLDIKYVQDIFFTHNDVPLSVLDQMVRRGDRLGEKGREITIHQLFMRGTIELEKRDKMKEDVMAIIKGIQPASTSPSSRLLTPTGCGISSSSSSSSSPAPPTAPIAAPRPPMKKRRLGQYMEKGKGRAAGWQEESAEGAGVGDQYEEDQYEWDEEAMDLIDASQAPTVLATSPAGEDGTETGTDKRKSSEEGSGQPGGGGGFLLGGDDGGGSGGGGGGEPGSEPGSGPASTAKRQKTDDALDSPTDTTPNVRMLEPAPPATAAAPTPAPAPPVAAVQATQGPSSLAERLRQAELKILGTVSSKAVVPRIKDLEGLCGLDRKGDLRGRMNAIEDMVAEMGF